MSKLVKVGDGTYIDPSVVIAVLPAHNMARGSYAFVGPAEDDHFYFAEVEPDELVALLSEAN